MATRATAFENILARFVVGLDKDEVDDFQFSTLDDIHNVIEDLQHKQARSRRMMNLPRIRSFLEAMKQYGEVIEVFLNATKFLAFVWGPVKFLLQVASTWTDAFDKLLGAYQQIGENIPLLQQYAQLFRDNQHMHRVLELVYFDILEFHRRALKFFKQRAWKQLFGSCWKTFGTRFEGILENLRRHRDLVESQAGIAQYEASQSARFMLEKNICNLEQSIVKQQLVSVRDWLCSARMQSDQERYTFIRAPFSAFGLWLTKHGRMVTWLDITSSSIPLLWFHGIPGAGKTILASLIVERVLKMPSVSTAYFYCKHADVQRNSYVGLVKSMLLQLIPQNRGILSYLYEKSSSSGESCLQSHTLAKELLRTTLESAGYCFLIIDGLDECEREEKRMIVSSFKTMIDSSAESEPGKLRCLFISQDDGDVRKLLLSVPEIRMRPEDSKADIGFYISHKALDIQGKFNITDQKRDEISCKVQDRAEGMFLFAKLVMTNLLNQTSRSKMLDELQPGKFPRGLEQAYARIVDRIFRDPENPEKEDAERLLGWLICAKRPLKWHEIQGAVSIDLSSCTIDFDNRQLCVDSKELCGSLVEVQTEGTVELVHLTARFYLIDRKLIDLAREELKMTVLCLAYLSFECFDLKNSNQDTRTFISDGSYALQDYAVAHWVDHLDGCIEVISEAEPESMKQLEDVLQKFLNYRVWYKSETNGDRTVAVTQRITHFFKSDIAEKLLLVLPSCRATNNQKDKLEIDDSYLGAQLRSVRSTFEKMVAVLTPNSDVEKEYRVYYGLNWFKCPKMDCLYFHTGFSSVKDRDQHLSKHGRPFRCTFSGCHVAGIGCRNSKELEKHMVEFHPSGQEGMDTVFPRKDMVNIDISKAASMGDMELVERLMEASGNESEDWYPLCCAARNGHDAVVRRLLQCRITQPSGRGRASLYKALEYAVRGAHESTVALFLLQGMIDLQGKQTRVEKLLCIAAEKGLPEIVSLLLPHCKDLNFQDSTGCTALMRASRRGRENIVCQLLENRKVDPNLTDRKSRTAIRYAAAKGHDSVVRRLLDCERMIKDDADWIGVAQLYNAARDGRKEICQELLNRDNVPVNICSNPGDTLLAIAVRNGHASVVVLFLRLNYQKFDDFRTLLIVAARRGHYAVTQLLLAQRNIDTQHYYNLKHYHDIANAVQIAEECGHDSIVRLLEEHQAQLKSWETPRDGSSAEVDNRLWSKAVDTAVRDHTGDLSSEFPFIG